MFIYVWNRGFNFLFYVIFLGKNLDVVIYVKSFENRHYVVRMEPQLL